MATAYFYMTEQGRAVVEKLQRYTQGEIFDKYHYKAGVRDFWQSENTLIFVMAAGIVVRTIAPYIQSKTSDPAVLVIDQKGQYVISLLSGHLGGANAQAERVAAFLGAEPVITTATDIEHVPAMDVFAKANKLKIQNIEQMKYVSGAMVEHQPVNIISQWAIDGTFPAWVKVYMIEDKHQFEDNLIQGVKNYENDSNEKGQISDFPNTQNAAQEKKTPHDENQNQEHKAQIDIHKYEYNPAYPAAIIGTPGFCQSISKHYRQADGGPFVCLTSPVYSVGTGCKKNMDTAIYERAFEAFLKSQNIDVCDIQALTTIDIKKDEACILHIADKYQFPVKIFSKEDIAAVDMSNASGKVIETSEFVRQVTGVGSVSEACAYLASDRGKILVGKTKYEGVTFALAEEKKVLKL